MCDGPRWYTPKSFARAFGFGEHATYEALHSGLLPHLRRGSRFVIPAALAEEFVDREARETARALREDREDIDK